MYAVYIAWGVLLLLFIVVLFAMRAKEARVARKLESVTDPMFRPSPPRSRAGDRKDSSTSDSAHPSRVPLRSTRTKRPAGQDGLKLGQTP
jgi:hypothetical protein